MVLMHAPSGYGKSVLIEQWAERDPRPYPTLILGDAHNDPAMLIGSIVAALDPIEPVAPEVGVALANLEPNIENVVLPRLGRALERRQVPVRPGPRRFRADQERPGARRGDDARRPRAAGVPAGARRPDRAGAADRPTARPPWDQRAGRPRPGDDQGGMRRVAARLSASSVTPEQLDTLVRRTEGWPAALYLAGLALRDSAEPDEAIDRFAGDDRFVVDYIREEFLEPVSRRQLDFLRRASVLDRLERRPLRRGPRAPRLGDAAPRALALEHAPHPARPPRRVVPLPPALPRDAARRAAALRARAGGGAAPARLRLVGRARRLGPGDQPRGRGRRLGPGRRAALDGHPRVHDAGPQRDA